MLTPSLHGGADSRRLYIFAVPDAILSPQTMLRQLSPGTTFPASAHRDPELLNSLVVPDASINPWMMLRELSPRAGRSSLHQPTGVWSY